ncbi:MAG: hypothetical protein QOC63_1893 [Mycobacterium sp.]|jgi:hypothetical protein|nr:hypothetical protein [Mycobacterium sp.]
MSNLYNYVRHPRLEELKVGHPIRTRDVRRLNNPNWLVRFNARFGLLITVTVGTMWCAYAFTALALFALPDAVKQGTYYIIVWLSSSFLQLVLLPIIIVGQNIQAKAADKRAEATYKDAEAVLKESEEIQKHLLLQDAAIAGILHHLQGLPNGDAKPAPSSPASPAASGPAS